MLFFKFLLHQLHRLIYTRKKDNYFSYLMLSQLFLNFVLSSSKNGEITAISIFYPLPYGLQLHTSFRLMLINIYISICDQANHQMTDHT